MPDVTSVARDTSAVEQQSIQAAAASRRLSLYPSSVVSAGVTTFALARGADRKRLIVVAPDDAPLTGFDGSTSPLALEGAPAIVALCDCSPANARALRQRVPTLAPRPLGLRKSAGCGDRLGLATPGHVRAFRSTDFAPVLAQQSMRENSRTGRTPASVIDDAMWGAFQEGWLEGFGADADHLKTLDDIEACVSAGFTMFTIDPSDHVDNAANTMAAAALPDALARLPWRELQTTWEDTRRRFGSPVDLGDRGLQISEETIARAAVKYARVVAHTVTCSQRLHALMGGRPFDLEMSVDESETVTSTAEHIYIAAELRRLGVQWASLAPRYVGEFEKGVDFIGDPAAFGQSFADHFAVAQAFGPYKLSLHSGSDKFSIFPIAARLAGDLVHLKTSGTSYLEALRVVSRVDPELFRAIATIARGRYAQDRMSYHVSATVDRMPDPASMDGPSLATLLDEFNSREILHVTFGSLISDAPLRARLMEVLQAHEEAYYEALRSHFEKHFSAFQNPKPA